MMRMQGKDGSTVGGVTIRTTSDCGERCEQRKHARRMKKQIGRQGDCITANSGEERRKKKKMMKKKKKRKRKRKKKKKKKACSAHFCA